MARIWRQRGATRAGTEDSVISKSTTIKPRLAALCLATMLAIGAGGHAIAQSGGQTPDDSGADAGAIDTPLNLPNDVAVFGKFDPTIRKATAIVNGFIITDTDVDQRLNLVLAANNQAVTAEERTRLQLQVLRNLIDETLEIQEAKSNDVTVPKEDIDTTFARVGIDYTDDCFEVAVNWRRDFTSIGDARRGSTIQFRLVFKNLGR